MKGRAKLELIDKLSGKVVQTIESDSLVTNALNTVFNLPTLCLLRYKKAGWCINASDTLGSYYKNMFGSNLADKMMCGILCFSSNILESVTHCIPTESEMDSLVAYASKRDGNDPDNAMRGSFDIERSVIESNYVTLVFNWNPPLFGRAIKSISLTSMMGGEQAYKGYQMELRKTLCHFADSFRMGSLDPSIDTPEQSIGDQPLCTLPFISRDDILYVLKSGKLSIASLKKMDRMNGTRMVEVNTWNFLDKSSLGISAPLVREYTLENANSSISFELSNILNPLIYSVYTTVSENSACILGITGTAGIVTIVGVVLSGDTTELTQFSVTISSEYAIQWGQRDQIAVVNGFIYCRSQEDKSLIYKIEITTGIVIELYIIGEFRAFGLFENQVLYQTVDRDIYRLESMSLFSINGIGVITKVDTLPEPLLVAYDTYSNWVSPSLCFLTAYLGTINNLPSTIIQSPETSMRVSYTLTDL